MAGTKKHPLLVIRQSAKPLCSENKNITTDRLRGEEKNLDDVGDFHKLIKERGKETWPWLGHLSCPPSRETRKGNNFSIPAPKYNVQYIAYGLGSYLEPEPHLQKKVIYEAHSGHRQQSRNTWLMFRMLLDKWRQHGDV